MRICIWKNDEISDVFLTLQAGSDRLGAKAAEATANQGCAIRRCVENIRNNAAKFDSELNLKYKSLQADRDRAYAAQPKEKIIDDLRSRVRTLETALGVAIVA